LSRNKIGFALQTLSNLPVIPETYQEDAYSGLLRHLPNRWFHELTDREGALFPLLWGLAGVLSQVRISYEEAQKAAIPMQSSGPWLSLHLKSIGLDRELYETDDQAKTRYQWEFEQTRNTREGLLRTIAHRTGLETPAIRLEGDRSNGKVGQFRIVIDDREQPWDELNLDFVGELIRRYVANGIIPGLRARLQCLLAAPLPPWQFYHQFPNSWTTQGPIWERPAFTTELRLDFAQNLFPQVSDIEWRENRDRLRKLHGGSLAGGAPGALFLYLSDPGECPYLRCDYALNLTTSTPEAAFPDRQWLPDGYQFHQDFPRLIQNGANLIAPFLEVPQGPLVQAAPIVPLTSLEVLPGWIGSGSQGTRFVNQYRGIDFSRLQIVGFVDNPEPSPLPEHNSPQLTAMRSGNWQLAIGNGDPRWGDHPPAGTAFVSTEFVIADPVSIWWTDSAGDVRSPTAIFDGSNVWLAIEYFFPASVARTVREIELRLQGQRVDYRRISLPIDDDVHLGCIFKVRGYDV
jgi:hypothetical protein